MIYKPQNPNRFNTLNINVVSQQFINYNEHIN